MMNVKITTFVELIIGVEVNQPFSIAIGCHYHLYFLERCTTESPCLAGEGECIISNDCILGITCTIDGICKGNFLFVLFCFELKLLFLIRDMQWYFSMR